MDENFTAALIITIAAESAIILGYLIRKLALRNPSDVRPYTEITV